MWGVPLNSPAVSEGRAYFSRNFIFVSRAGDNPVVIASTYAAFGFSPVFWGRLGLTLGIAIISGMVFSRQVDVNRSCASR